MKYPCIVYHRQGDHAVHADNRRYLSRDKYAVTVIDANPDSRLPEALEGLPLCSMTSSFTSDNLHHFVYELYY